MQSVAARVEALKSKAIGFLRWWRDELCELLPAPVREHLAGAGGRIIVASAPGGFRVFEEPLGPAGVGPPLEQPEALNAVGQIARGSPKVSIAVRVSAQSCFQRSVELPSATRADIRRILDLDLERSTPFKLKDVYTAYLVEPGPPGRNKIKARQLVAKRAAIDAILEPLLASGLQVACADCWREDISVPLPVNFLAPRNGNQRRPRLTVPMVLAAVAGVLVTTAVTLALWRNESALDSLQARIADARGRAANVRQTLESSEAALDELTRLQRMKATEVPVVVILDELSKLLPDTVWITELRQENDTLDMSGLARSGASLVSLFERSHFFSDATMTAPLTLDQREDKERFSLRARVRKQHPERSSLSEGSR